MPADRPQTKLKSSIAEVERLWSALLCDDADDNSDDAEWRYIGPPPDRESHSTRDDYKCRKSRDLLITEDRSLGIVIRLIIIHEIIGGPRSKFFNNAQLCIDPRKRRPTTDNTTNLLRLGNSLGGNKLMPNMKEAVAAFVETEVPRAGSDQIDTSELFDRPFRGMKAVQEFRRLVEDSEVRAQPFAKPAVFDAPAGSDRAYWLSECIDALTPRNGSSSEPMLINVHAEGAWSELSALSYRIHEELVKRADRRPILVLPLVGRSNKLQDRQVLPAMNFAQVVGYLRHFFIEGLDGVADAAPLDDAENLFEVLHEIRCRMIERPAILVFDGLYLPEDFNASSPLVRQVADDLTLSLVFRLLDPAICSAEAEGLLESEILVRLRRNRIVILTNRPAKVIEKWPKLAGTEDPVIVSLPSRDPTTYAESLNADYFANLGDLRRLRREIDCLRTCCYDDAFLTLDAVVSICKALPGTGVEAVSDQLQKLPREISSAANPLSGIVHALVEVLTVHRPVWRDLLFLISFTPDGLRKDTILRLARRSNFLRETKYKLFGEMSSEEVSAELDTLLVVAANLVAPSASDHFAGVDSHPHMVEFGDPETDWANWEKTPADTYALCFVLPTLRGQLREVAGQCLSSDLYHAVHRLLAEDALQQQTIAFRHADIFAMHYSIRPWRRMLSAFYHGLQSIPIKHYGRRRAHGDHKGSGGIDNRDFACRDLTSPSKARNFWLWLYLFAYRRIMERPPAWNLARLHGLEELKAELLDLFDRPWLIWPESMTPRDALTRPGLFEHENKSLSGWKIYLDHCLAAAQSHYAIGMLSASSTALADIETSAPQEGRITDVIRLSILKRRLDIDVTKGGRIEEIRWASGVGVHGTPDSLLPTVFRDMLGNTLAEVERCVEEDTDETQRMILSCEVFEDDIQPFSGYWKLAGSIIEGLEVKDLGSDASSSVADLLFRIAEHHATQADLASSDSSIQKSEWTVALPFERSMFSTYQPISEAEVIREFCLSLSIFRIAEKLRLRTFSTDPLSAHFFASGHAARQMIRVALKLENMARAIAHSKGRKPESPGAFARLARRTADTLTRHLFRFPRERASMLILEASMLRLLATDTTRQSCHENATKFIAKAEPIVLGLGRSVRIRLRLALERAKLSRAKAAEMHQHGKVRQRDQYIDLCATDIAYLKFMARTEYPLDLWLRLADLQGERLNALIKEIR